MRKIVSLLLALCLVCTLLPCTFAAETTVERSGVKVVYRLSDHMETLAYGSSEADGGSNDMKDINSDITDGFYSFLSNPADSAHYEKSSSGAFGYGVLSNLKKRFVSFTDNSKVSFEILVPKAGTYTFEMYNFLSNNSNIKDAYVNVYLSKGAISTAAADKVGTYTCYTDDPAKNSTIPETPSNVGDVEIVKPGKYIVTFTTTNSPRWHYNNIGTFVLNGGDDVAPMITDVSAEEEIDIGEETEITVITEYMSDAETFAEGVTYTYASSDNAIATVDENGRIKGSGVGTATITVTATKDGVSSSRTVDIFVSDPDAAKINLTYNFSSNMIGWKEVDPGFASLTYDKTKDFNAYYTNSAGHLGHHSDKEWFKGSQTDTTGARRGLQLAYPNVWYAATIRVPVSGKYVASVDYAKYYSSTGYLGVYLFEKDADLSGEEIEASLTEANMLNRIYQVDSTAKSATWQDEPAVLKTVDLTAGEYYLVFKQQDGGSYAWFGDFYLNGYGSGTAPIITDCTAEKTELEIDETADIETAVRYITDGSSAEGVAYAYESSAPGVAEVSADGTITAKAAGNATITVTATATNATLPGTRTIDITVNAPTILPEEEEITDTTVLFKAGAYTGGTVSNDDIQEVTIGTDVTVTATADVGYTFAYWKNSAGVVLSTNATETFKVSTNMAVIAVFDKDVAEGENIPVYFYNGNGILLKDTTVAKDTTFGVAKDAANVGTPSLTGFTFSHWSDKDAEVAIADSDLITALTRAVAIYKDDETKTFTVKNGDATVASGKKYGDSVTVNGSDNFKAWKLVDKVMSYEKDYTFNVYGDITLTEVTDETMAKAPVLVLDKVDGNYFLTYDAGNYELVEAGILFAKTGTPEIGSYNSKAIAVKGTGQFTAQPSIENESIARGYMICKDGNSYKVIYAD